MKTVPVRRHFGHGRARSGGSNDRAVPEYYARAGMREKGQLAFLETNNKSEPRAGRRRIQGGEAFSFDIQTGLLRLAQNRKKQNSKCVALPSALHQAAPSSLRANRAIPLRTRLTRVHNATRA